MTNIEQLLDKLIQREGGYSNHPADRGGPTKWGITEHVARTFGYAGAIKDLSQETAKQIYRQTYWKGPHFDSIATITPIIAEELFDTGVNMGPAIAIGFLQRALNALNRNGKDFPDIAVDKVLGPRTIKALHSFISVRGKGGEKVLLKAIDALQGEHYITLAEHRPANKAFLYGWISNRIG